MSDAQVTILITVLGTGLGAIAAAIRWAVGRVTKSMDINSAAMLENTKSNTVLSTKIDIISNYVQGRSKLSSDVKEFIRDEISGVHSVAGSEDVTPVEKTMPVPGGAYSKVKRAKSEPGGTR